MNRRVKRSLQDPEIFDGYSSCVSTTTHHWISFMWLGTPQSVIPTLLVAWESGVRDDKYFIDYTGDVLHEQVHWVNHINHSFAIMFDNPSNCYLDIQLLDAKSPPNPKSSILDSSGTNTCTTQHHTGPHLTSDTIKSEWSWQAFSKGSRTVNLFLMHFKKGVNWHVKWLQLISLHSLSFTGNGSARFECLEGTVVFRRPEYILALIL